MTTQGASVASVEADQYRPVSYLDITPGSGSQRVKLTAAPVTAIAEILYIPGEGICIPLTEPQLELLKASADRLNAVAQELVQAKESGDRKTILQAQAKVRETLRQEAAPSNDLDEQAKDLPPLMVGGTPEFTEGIRIAGQEISLIPSRLVEQFRTRADGSNNTFSLYEAAKKELKQETLPKNLNDPMQPWRDDETGRLNKEKFRNTFAQVKANIAAEWELYDSKTGQIPSRYLVNPAIAALFQDELTALDNWIEKFNEEAKWIYDRRSEKREELIQLLDRDDFNEDDWDQVKTVTLDLWGEEQDEHGNFARQITGRAFPKRAAERAEIARNLQQQPLPPTRFNAEAGAQLMRYSNAGTGKFDISFQPGKPCKISAEASIELDLALIEGKASGSFYLPHSQGQQLSFTVKTKREDIKYKESENSLKYSSTQSPPHFAVNSFLVTPGAFQSMCRMLRQMNIIRNSSPRRTALLRVIGHTSLTGPEDYNLKLSERRAAAAYAALDDRADIWMGFFKDGIWGESEVRFLGLYVALCERNLQYLVDWDQVDSLRELERQFEQVFPTVISIDGKPPNFEWLQRLLTPNMTEFVREVQQYFPQIDLPEVTPNSGIILPSKPEWNPSSRDGHLTLYWLIRAYFTHLRRSVSLWSAIDGHDFFEDALFHELPYLGQGEQFPLEPSEQESRRNRRVEFVVLRIDESETKTLYENVKVDFGYFRMSFTGSIGIWAGANLTLAGHIEFQPSKMGKTESQEALPANRLAMVGRVKDNIYKNDVGGTAALFAGARAELGLKAAFEWAPPAEPAPPEEDASPATAEFKTLGSAGYTLSGLAGAGLGGEFKIGFDRIAMRFVIRIKAEAALGLGFGGCINFHVGIREMGDFIILVWQKLAEADFSWIDLFEGENDASGINVFELFSAFAWKLLSNGNVSGAMKMLAVGGALDGMVTLLQQADDLIDEWKIEQADQERVSTLVEAIERRPALLRYLTPETKGRILFELATTQRSWKDYLNDTLNLDWNHKREEAAVTLIEMGISSLRDWRETLEHLCEITKDGRRVPYVTPGADPETKVLRMVKNLQFLKETLLSDEEDWQRVHQHLQKLAKR